MEKQKKNRVPVQKLRLGIQILGFILTVAGFFSGLPTATTILIGVTFLMGPVFCGWVCPYGFLQDLAAKLGRFLGLPRLRLPKPIQKVLVIGRYLLFLLVLFISADFIFSLLSLDPRANFENVLGGNLLTAAGWTIMGLFLLIGVFFDRPFCNYLCVEGAKYGIYGLFRPITITRRASSCVNCGKCDKACPMQIEVSTHSQVRSAQCINCMACTAACPVQDTLKITPVPLKKPMQKAVLPFMLIAALSCFAYIAYNDNNLIVPSIEVSASSGTYPEEGNSGDTQISDETSDGIEADSTQDSSQSAASNSTTTSGTADSDAADSTTETITGDEAAAYGDAAGIADGTYEGTGTGFRGDMTVAVTVADQTITAIEITETNDDAKWLNRAYSGVAEEILSSQTTDVDSVTGATYSSMGIKEAVADALTAAGGTNVDTIVNNLPASRGRH